MSVTTCLNPSPQLQGCITVGPFAGLSTGCSLQQQQQQQRANHVSKEKSKTNVQPAS
jgi:hypothetical protein